MCQRRQKSIIELALYGELKFAGNVTPKRRASPIAMSEYPEKSKYSWKVYASTPPQAARRVSVAPPFAASNTGVENSATPSARTTFLNRPIAKIVTPTAKFSALKR